MQLRNTLLIIALVLTSNVLDGRRRHPYNSTYEWNGATITQRMTLIGERVTEYNLRQDNKELRVTYEHQPNKYDGMLISIINPARLSPQEAEKEYKNLEALFKAAQEDAESKNKKLN